MIDLEDLSMRYAVDGQAVDVLRGIDLAVAEGESVAVIGPSGSDKTTLLLLLAGLEKPGGGSIRLDGVSMAALDADALADLRGDRVGIIFQAFHLVLTGIMASSRTRQVYDATILHSLGAGLRLIEHSLRLEYALLALITSLFAIVMRSAIAVPLPAWRLKLPVEAPLHLGVLVALSVSGPCLYLGARYLLRRLGLNPAMLLRSGG